MILRDFPMVFEAAESSLTFGREEGGLSDAPSLWNSLWIPLTWRDYGQLPKFLVTL